MKLPFGIRDGELHHVSEVERGLACGCVCPCCGVRLVARKGAKVGHHFAHDSVAECAGAVQTALHLKAKEILARRREIALPPVPVAVSRGSGGRTITLSPSTRLNLDEVRVEETAFGFVPDLSASIGDRRLFIEVRVTHRVDAVKLARMKATGTAVLEIDLSKEQRIFDAERLETRLVDAIEGKVWLYNPRAAAIEDWIASRAIRRRISREGHGFHPPVPGCPIMKGAADLINDCFCCRYLWDVDGGPGENAYPSVVLCVGTIRDQMDSLINERTSS